MVKLPGSFGRDIHKVPCVQEFESAMLDLMAKDVSKKARRTCQKMVKEWFREIDADDSGVITFHEFIGWYQRSVGDAKANGVT